MSGRPVVAVVPAKDREDTVADTVAALLATGAVDEVVVVDDGSRDRTAPAARAAGASVLRLPRNLGKGGAVTAAVHATPDASTYLLIDADVGGTAALAAALLPPVLDGEADMTIAVLPAAGRRGGFGNVRELARRGIARATGFSPRAPLSGQRAVDGELLRLMLPLAARFGLETGLTVDALRYRARVVEIDVAMEHRHTGRSVAGFRHRARQGADVIRALWPRLTSERHRIAVIVAAFLALAVAALGLGSQWEPSSVAATRRPSRVVLFGIPKLGWEDLGSGALPTVDGLIASGAVAAMSVRTIAGRPTTTEGYATLGAGTRVAADELAAYAFDAGQPIESGTPPTR